MNYFLLAFGLFFPILSQAKEVLKSPPDLAVGSMIASLLLVITCIFVFAFLMKKSNLTQYGRGKKMINVIASQPLTSKGRVQIIEVDDKRYLLGITDQNICVIDTFSVPENEVNTDPITENKFTSFASLFSKISNKRND